MNLSSFKVFFKSAKIKRVALLLGLVHMVYHLHSQNSIEGTVKDSKTNEPLLGATIYLANSTHGTFASNTGTFSLTQIPLGMYDFVVTMIGYKPFLRPILINNQIIKDFTVYLEEEIKQLDTIEVKAKRKISGVEFKTTFLGQTKNSSHCRIVNLHDIFVHKDKAGLHATSQKPVEVINNALGYRIYFDLKEFVVDYTNNNRVTMLGTPRFEYLIPKSKKQENRWNEERDRAYYGSIEHFLRSLKKRKLKHNYFSVFDSHDREINEDFLLQIRTDSILYYKNSL